MTFTEIYFCSVLHYFSGKILQAEDLRKTNYLSSRILIKLFADSTLVDTGLSRGRPVRRKSLWNVLCVQDTFIFVSISGLVVSEQVVRFLSPDENSPLRVLESSDLSWEPIFSRTARLYHMHFEFQPLPELYSLFLALFSLCLIFRAYFQFI